jgi:hypothetical protein
MPTLTEFAKRNSDFVNVAWYQVEGTAAEEVQKKLKGVYYNKPAIITLANGKTGKDKLDTLVTVDVPNMTQDEEGIVVDQQLLDQLVEDVKRNFNANFRSVDQSLFNTLSTQVTTDEDYPKYVVNYAFDMND